LQPRGCASADYRDYFATLGMRVGRIDAKSEGVTARLSGESAAGFTLEQSRQVVIATVSGAPPLADTIFLYRRRAQ
jgi:hypothetical protein